jgi:hypothetical protein
LSDENKKSILADGKIKLIMNIFNLGKQEGKNSSNNEIGIQGKHDEVEKDDDEEFYKALVDHSMKEVWDNKEDDIYNDQENLKDDEND